MIKHRIKARGFHECPSVFVARFHHIEEHVRIGLSKTALLPNAKFMSARHAAWNHDGMT